MGACDENDAVMCHSTITDICDEVLQRNIQYQGYVFALQQDLGNETFRTGWEHSGGDFPVTAEIFTTQELREQWEK